MKTGENGRSNRKNSARELMKARIVARSRSGCTSPSAARGPVIDVRKASEPISVSRRAATLSA